MLESVKFVHALVHEHGVSPSVEGADPYNLFSAGRVAMTAGGRWPLETYLAGDFTTMDIQNWPGKSPQRRSSGRVVGPSASQARTQRWPGSSSKNSPRSRRTSPSQGIGAAIPAMESATQIDAYQALPEHADLFYASLQDARPVPAPANFTEVQAIFMRHMTSILSNAVTPRTRTRDGSPRAFPSYVTTYCLEEVVGRVYTRPTLSATHAYNQGAFR
jgi:multiple sugar transport system substrate-binding protein